MINKLEHYLESKLHGIVKKGEVPFWGWFFVIFLGTAAVLSAFGILPSELKEESDGNTFIESGEQKIDALLGGENIQGTEDTQSIQSTQSIQGGSFSEFPAQAKTSSKNSNTGGTIGVSGGAGTSGQTGTEQYGIVPSRLIIPSINVDTVINNPVSTSIAKLDYELTKGPVRYPGSGTIGSGNMFIFGHSTGWSVVQNKAYKVFNNIKTLTAGDLIYVMSGTTTYTYKVREVTEVNKNETLITFDTNVKMLTLSTCDSFGAKTDRYVVTADFVGVR